MYACMYVYKTGKDACCVGGAEQIFMSCSYPVGSGIWITQEALVEAVRCTIRDCGRAGVVCFGSARLRLLHSLVSGAVQHGVCAAAG